MPAIALAVRAEPSTIFEAKHVFSAVTSAIGIQHGVEVLDNCFLCLENFAFQQVNYLSLTVVLSFFNASNGHCCCVLFPVIFSSRDAFLPCDGN